jgi:environmental stress-induced protein Ves
VTRELLAWPDPQDWLLRVSVADIHESGAFSGYPGVDRWFAVLAGGAVRLETAGAEPAELTALRPGLHAFSGEAATHCTALGPSTRDFNLMVTRGRVRMRQQPLPESAVLETRAEFAGLFVAQAAELRQPPGAPWQLPAMSLAWWSNPGHELLSLRVVSAATRGWWFAVDRDLRHAP